MRPRQVPAAQVELFAPDSSPVPTARYTNHASTHPLAADLDLKPETVAQLLAKGSAE